MFSSPLGLSSASTSSFRKSPFKSRQIGRTLFSSPLASALSQDETPKRSFEQAELNSQIFHSSITSGQGEVTSRCKKKSNVQLSNRNAKLSSKEQKQNVKNKTKKKCKTKSDITKEPRKFHKWLEEDMRKAIQATKNGDMSLRKAALNFGVPRSSLQERVRGKRDIRPTLAENLQWL